MAKVKLGIAVANMSMADRMRQMGEEMQTLQLTGDSFGALTYEEA